MCDGPWMVYCEVVQLVKVIPILGMVNEPSIHRDFHCGVPMFQDIIGHVQVAGVPDRGEPDARIGWSGLVTLWLEPLKYFTPGKIWKCVKLFVKNILYIYDHICIFLSIF